MKVGLMQKRSEAHFDASKLDSFVTNSKGISDNVKLDLILGPVFVRHFGGQWSLKFRLLMGHFQGRLQ